jgi:hypothetical protein
MGFKMGKPVAACIIYRCLLHWGVFETERTTIFDFIIQTINTILKVIVILYILEYLNITLSLLDLVFCFSDRK